MPLPNNLRIHLAPTGADSKVVDADTGLGVPNVLAIACGVEALGRSYLEIKLAAPTVVIDGETKVIYRMDEADLERVAADMGFKLVVA